MAADAHAARVVGSRERIALALVHLTRAKAAAPAFALGFGASNLELRVRDLLDERPRREWPASTTLCCLFALSALAIALHADDVHHAVEHALGLLSG
jgi:hypothetical protein